MPTDISIAIQRVTDSTLKSNTKSALIGLISSKPAVSEAIASLPPLLSADDVLMAILLANQQGNNG